MFRRVDGPFFAEDLLRAWDPQIVGLNSSVVSEAGPDAGSGSDGHQRAARAPVEVDDHLRADAQRQAAGGQKGERPLRALIDLVRVEVPGIAGGRRL